MHRVAAVVVSVLVVLGSSRARADEATGSARDDDPAATIPVAVLPHAQKWTLATAGGDVRTLVRLRPGDYTATIAGASRSFTLTGPTAVEYHEALPILRWGGLGMMGAGVVTAGVTFWIASHECDAQTSITPGTAIPVTRRPCDAGDAEAHSREKTQLTLILVGSAGAAFAIAGGFVFFAAKPWVSVEPLDLRELASSRRRAPTRVSLRLGPAGALLSGVF